MTYFNDTLEQEESNITSNISLCNFHTYDLDKLLLRSGIDITLFDKIMEALPVVSSNGPWLGGGALRRLLSGTDIFGSDFDFFFASKEQMDDFEKELVDNCLQVESVHKTKNAITYKGKIKLENESDCERKDIIIQLININYYNKVDDLLDSFDFTICQFAWDGKNLHCGEYSLWDLARKKLAVHKITYPVASVRRMIKYTKQDFYACSGCIKKILETVASNPESIDLSVEYVD